MPIHNKVYSKPQGADPEWNKANSRNRRFFKDETGLKGAKNQSGFLIQLYKREMGNNTFIMMKDVTVPIWINGKHWGAFRIGYKA